MFTSKMILEQESVELRGFQCEATLHLTSSPWNGGKIQNLKTQQFHQVEIERPPRCCTNLIYSTRQDQITSDHFLIFGPFLSILDHFLTDSNIFPYLIFVISFTLADFSA